MFRGNLLRKAKEYEGIVIPEDCLLGLRGAAMLARS